MNTTKFTKMASILNLDHSNTEKRFYTQHSANGLALMGKLLYGNVLFQYTPNWGTFTPHPIIQDQCWKRRSDLVWHAVTWVDWILVFHKLPNGWVMYQLQYTNACLHDFSLLDILYIFVAFAFVLFFVIIMLILAHWPLNHLKHIITCLVWF